MMNRELLGSLVDEEFRIHDSVVAHVVPGVCLLEWFRLYLHDYDGVDRLYIDHETMGA